MTSTDADPTTAGDRSRPIAAKWRAAVTVLGFAGLVVAAATTIDDAKEQALPGVGPLVGALGLQFIAMLASARAWASLFPSTSHRPTLIRALYVSQLTKYLPAGGFVQAASQVALSGQQQGDLARAAFRLPIFALCTLVSGATFATGLAFNTALPWWGRVLAACGVLSLSLLHRSILAAVLRTARRVVHRLPEPSSLPPQDAILRCFGFAIVNMACYGIAFALLMGHVADVNPVWTATAFCAGWAAGYAVLPLPSGLGVREAVIIAALPGLGAGPLLAASVAHRVTGFIAEAVLAAGAQLRTVRARRQPPLSDKEQR